jgi:hypothetical protein
VNRIEPFRVLGLIGAKPAIWYAVYRGELAAGISRARTPVGSWDLVFKGANHPAPPWDPQNQPPFFFRDPREFKDILIRLTAGAEFLAREELERVLSGSFRLWEDSFHALGFPPDWNRNPLTGRSLPADRHWSDIPEGGAGDIKGVWELSRFAVAFRLVRCYVLTGDERAPEAFWRLVESWLAANPPNAGPQWASAQEAALRAMAWIFALRAFAFSPATTPDRVRKLTAAMDVHARRIEATTAYARAQNNNHLISEGAGLYTIGAMFPGEPGAGRRRSLGMRLLAESVSQFYPDGGYIQHSHNYTRLAVQLYLWTARLAQLNGHGFPEGMRRSWSRAFDLLRTMADRTTGRLPNFGHNDGALFLPLNSCACEDYRPVLQMLSIVRDKKKIFRDGSWDEDTVWLFGPGAIGGTNRRHPRGVEFESRPYYAPCAGLYILGGDESQAVVRCVRFRSRPAHADQLHADLWWRNENVAIDAGSYLYGGDPPWRNALAGAGVHNSVTVDGRDQMARSGRFLWTRAAQGTVDTPGPSALRASHDGYRSLGVTHERLVELAEDDIWVVTDEIAGTGRHTARLHWLLPDYPWEPAAPGGDPIAENLRAEKFPAAAEGAAVGIVFRTPAGGIVLRIWSDKPIGWDLFREGRRIGGTGTADETVPGEIRGWRSVRYGSKLPALSVSVLATGETPIRFVSIWAPAPRGK